MARPRTVSRSTIARAVVSTAQEMSRRGLSPGRSGNVSARFNGGLLITPSGVAYDVLTPDDIVEVDEGGRTPQASLKPSSEWQLHAAVYARRTDAGAIVHCHSMHATVLASARLPIPAFHYMVAAAGGPDIPCTPYATFGSEELARAVAAALRQRDACLMANHGQTAIGATLAAALDLAGTVEMLAEQYMKVRLLGDAHVLAADEMERVAERFRSGYGQSPQKASRH